MGAANEAKREWRARLHERDRELLGHLALTRYLSTEQVAALLFPGRHITVARKRLRKLEGSEDGVAYVRRMTWRTFEGVPQLAWCLADAGYIIAEQLLGPVRVPARDVSAQFMEHTLALNELYVRLLAAELVAAPGQRPEKGNGGLSPLARVGAFARAAGARFRWIASDAAELPWTEYDQRAGKQNERVIRPDAVVELAVQSRRLFIECEMGTHAIVARQEDKAGATLHKLERYAAFVNGLADAAARQTFYARRYPDRCSPELVFLVQTEHRAESVKRAIAAWRKTRELGALLVRVDVIDSLVAALLAELGVAPVKPHRAAAAAASAAVAPASRQLSREELDHLRAFCSGAVATLKTLRDAARARRESPPAYPPHADTVLQLLQRLRGERESA